MVDKIGHLEQLLHPGSLTVSWYWIQKTWDERVRLSLCNFSSLKSIHVHIMSVMPTKSCGDGKVVKTASADYTYAAVTNLHTWWLRAIGLSLC